MKHSILTVAFFVVATALSAQDHHIDEIAIKKVILQQEAAWNKHDWEGFSSYFTEDGTLINFLGQFWQGRKDIIMHFNLFGDCCLVPTSLKFEFKNARFITPDIAVVYIEETLIANKDYDVPFRRYKKGEIDYKMKSDVFVRQNDKWMVAATQLTLINQVVSPHGGASQE